MKVKKVGGTGAIGTAEARHGHRAAAASQGTRPFVLAAFLLNLEPGTDRFGGGSQVIDVPVPAHRTDPVPRQSRPKTAGAKGAARVDVVARPELQPS